MVGPHPTPAHSPGERKGCHRLQPVNLGQDKPGELPGDDDDLVVGFGFHPAGGTHHRGGPGCPTPTKLIFSTSAVWLPGTQDASGDSVLWASRPRNIGLLRLGLG